MSGVGGVLLRRENMGAHFTKFHLGDLPVAAVLHRFTAAEPEADPHDHPWGFTSFVVCGGYVEEVFNRYGTSVERVHLPGESLRVEAGHVHRIVRLVDGECWTLVLPGPTERVSGFYRWTADGTPLHRPWNRPDFRPMLWKDQSDFLLWCTQRAEGLTTTDSGVE